MMHLLGRPVLAALVAAAGIAQSTAPPPAFTDVLVTRSTSRDGMFFTSIRGRFFAKNVTLRMLVRTAYGVQDAQVVGGPGWIDADRFNIEAEGDIGDSPALPVTHDGGPSRLQLMMRALLADRFKLTVHRDSQTADIYTLTLVNSDGRLGPALSRSDVDCLALALEARRMPSPRRMQGGCALSRNAGTLRIEGRPLSQLTSSISNIVGKPVIDDTGLTGNFDVHLEWSRDPATVQPSISRAIRDELGLQLVPHRQVTDVLVVDHAERPMLPAAAGGGQQGGLPRIRVN